MLSEALDSPPKVGPKNNFWRFYLFMKNRKYCSELKSKVVDEYLWEAQVPMDLLRSLGSVVPD